MRADESVSWKLGLLATLSAIGVGLAIWRGFVRGLRLVAAQRLARNSTRIELEAISVPTFVLQHSFPIIAVVGAIRPRLFIANHVLESLSHGRARGGVAHECGHLAAHDNFKRSVMRVSRAALLLIPCGRSSGSRVE
jgi:beta-lactamase regulating signal transducer with metallopeptidase domain